MVGEFELSVPGLNPLLGLGHGLDYHGQFVGIERPAPLP